MKLKSKKDDAELIGIDDAKEFSIDNESSMIVSILRDKLYKNKIAAVCREISSNARDANREAGKQDIPIEITIHKDEQDLMGDGSTLISFKDNGIGINPDRMENIFLKYGGSTKRDTDGQTGGFGIGAKTPFAYTDNFLITTVCVVEGKTVEYLYQAVIIADGVKERTQLILIDSQEVDKKTGTTITVPICSEEDDERIVSNKIINFEYETVYATILWDVKPILKNFEMADYEKYQINTLKQGEKWKVINDKERLFDFNKHIIASVDGIPYPIDITEIKDIEISQKLNKIYGNWDHKKTIIEIDTGEVTLSASREDVEYIPENLKVFVEKYEKLKNDILQEANELINKEKTTLSKVTTINALKGRITININDNEKLSTLKSIIGDLHSKLSLKEKCPFTYSEIFQNFFSFFHTNLYHASDSVNMSGRINVFDLKNKKIIYRTSNSSSLRNQTLIEKGYGSAFFIMPKKSGRDFIINEETDKILETFRKYLAEEGIEIINYEDIEKAKRKKANSNKKNNDVSVPVRNFPGRTHSSWKANCIEVDKKTLEISESPWSILHENCNKSKKDSKVILLYVNSITQLNAVNKEEVEVFGSKKLLPDYFESKSRTVVWSEVFRLLENELDYNVFVTSSNKAKYFKDKKYKTVKDIKKIINKEWLAKRKTQLKEWLDYNAIEKLDVASYINDKYLEYPEYLELANISVKDIEKTKKVSDIELSYNARQLTYSFSEEMLKIMAKQLKLKPKDYGLEITYDDIENAVKKIKKEYKAISMIFDTMTDSWNSIANSYGGKEEIWVTILKPMIKKALSERKKKS